MAQLRGRRTHLTGICNNQLQWCQNPEIEHGGTTTGPARRGAKPNGGRESGRSRWQCYAASGNSCRTAQSAGCSSDWVLADTATSPIGIPRMANAIRSRCPAAVPVARLRPAKAQPTFAPVPTPRVGAASTRQVPTPVPLHFHHLLSPVCQRDLLCRSWGSGHQRDLLSLSWLTVCRRVLLIQSRRPM